LGWVSKGGVHHRGGERQKKNRLIWLPAGGGGPGPQRKEGELRAFATGWKTEWWKRVGR